VTALPAAQVVTLTANPSLDRTLELPGALDRGGVQRLTGAQTEPGGKGVNVSRALAAAGAAVVSVLPAPDDDPILGALRRLGLVLATVPVRTAVRTNYTVAEPDGTTTKLNEPGAPLDDPTRTALAAALCSSADGARWVVLSGSLPPGTPPGWYAALVQELRGTGARVAVDTSGEPLRALLDAGPAAAPDLLKPNAEELAQLAGTTEDEVLADHSTAAAAVEALHRRGVGEVLLTLGADGALLSTPEGVWTATPPRVAVRSTVGAGDCSLAGYLLADLAGAPPADRLRSAVAYGAASAALPGSAVPTPAQVDGSAVRITAVRVTAGQPGSGTTPHPVPAAGRDAR
jgi:1-phosphofructokinase